MAHLKGNQWRQSKSAGKNKERSKYKSLGLGSDNSFKDKKSYSNGYNEFAIVIEVLPGTVAVLYNHKRVKITLKSIFNKRLKSLVPGDRVAINVSGDTFTVGQMLPRSSELTRIRRDYTRHSRSDDQIQIIAANIDTGVIVASAKNPPFHPKFIDRYLILLQRSDIDPVICLNKSDLASKADLAKLKKYENLGIKTFHVSSINGEGIDILKNQLFGKMTVLVGHSGVGKTSLMNAIDSNATYEVGEVSAKTGKGRHTTTSSFLHEWDEGSYIIDTPGIRSLEVWNMDADELQWYFPEIISLKGLCKYNDCLHYQEPIGSCAVKNAVSQKGIDQDRYNSYIRILEDLL